MNLPTDFITSISLLLQSETDSFLSSLKEKPPVSIRFNPFKVQFNQLRITTPESLSIDTYLTESLSIESPVPWSENGYYLKERPSFTFDPLFHAGYYYVQEASSMFIEQVVKQLVQEINQKPDQEAIVCLDLCAAPGGKSTSILSVLPQGSLLVSNEIIRHRANILSETMIKFGHPNSVVTNNEAKDFQRVENLFDLILVDAPCSGEGMFRKDEIAIQEWSADNVKICTLRQKTILEDIWPSLKPGGIIIYSTCTYNTLENEENALYIANKLGAEFIEIEIDKAWNITPSINKEVKAYRFFPHKTKGEGLFVTVLRKSTEEQSEDKMLNQYSAHSSDYTTTTSNHYYGNKKGKKNKKDSTQIVKDKYLYTKYINSPEDFDYIDHNNRIIALPKTNSTTLLNIKENLRIVSMGIELGEIKGKDFIPSHSLAMSRELNSQAFAIKELNYDEAISYLRREAISIPDVPKGFVLLTYKNEPIGFVKNIGNRANNLYPNEWRIRK